MQFFEILLLATLTLLPFTHRKLAAKIKPDVQLFALGVLLVLHIVFDGWRWQMTPAYILILLVGWNIKASELIYARFSGFLRFLGYVGIITLLALGWLLPNLLPVFELPEPTGQYTVGTTDIHFKTDLKEEITADTTDYRELIIKLWYPSEADISDMEPEVYVDPASREGFVTKYGLPANTLNYLDYVETHVYDGIDVAKGTFSVLIFSHGYGSKATGYYALLSELASHGYIVVNMNHTYESLGTTFPDGRKTYFDYAFQNQIASGNMEVIQPVIDAFREGLDYEQRHETVREASLNYFEGRIQDRWASDIIEVLNELPDWNKMELLQGSMNLDKIGALGHSVGGGTAGNVALKDDRIQAAVNLDGIQWGSKIDTTYHIPYLYVSADWPADHEDINAHVYKYKSSHTFYEAKLLKSGHPNFMDIPFMVPVPTLAGTGNIDPYLGAKIVNELVVSFFDRHLKNEQNADPRAVEKAYKELQMVVW